MGTKKIYIDTIQSRNKKSTEDIEQTIIIKLASAAATGSLKQVNPELLTKKNISLQNPFGLNCLHCAATHAKLDAVPKELLIEEVLLTKDHTGQTVLHYTAEHNQMNALPKNMMNKKNLLSKDIEGNSVYHYLANYGTLDSIPKDLIDEEVVLAENNFKKNVLMMAIHSEAKEINPKLDQSHLLLHCLNSQVLKDLIKKNPKDKLLIKACKNQLVKNTAIKQIKKEEKDISFEV